MRKRSIQNHVYADWLQNHLCLQTSLAPEKIRQMTARRHPSFIKIIYMYTGCYVRHLALKVVTIKRSPGQSVSLWAQNIPTAGPLWYEVSLFHYPQSLPRFLNRKSFTRNEIKSRRLIENTYIIALEF